MSQSDDYFQRNLEDFVLYSMHNLCITRPELSKTSEEIAGLLKIELTRVKEGLTKLISFGYVKTYANDAGTIKYHLSGTGVLRVCGMFT